MGTLVFVDEQLILWRNCRQKILAQLSSIMNLIEQLEAVKGGRLGVLCQHSYQVTPLLETKLIQSMEKALDHIKEDK